MEASKRTGGSGFPHMRLVVSDHCHKSTRKVCWALRGSEAPEPKVRRGCVFLLNDDYYIAIGVLNVRRYSPPGRTHPHNGILIS